MKMLLWLGLWFPENWTMICIGRAHTHWLISPWTMIGGIFLLMDLSLLNLLWSGRLGGVRIQEDKLILDVSKEVQGMVRASTNDSQWGWQCEAGFQPRYVDRVDIAEPEPQRDEKEQWFPWALLSFILGWLQTTFPHLKMPNISTATDLKFSLKSFSWVMVFLMLLPHLWQVYCPLPHAQQCLRCAQKIKFFQCKGIHELRLKDE